MKRLALFLVIFICCLSCNKEKVQKEASTFPCVQQNLPFSPEIFLDNGYHFYVIGDSGTGDEHQLTSARRLESYHLNYPLDAILHTGDIFYPKGISAQNQVGIYDKFAAIYPAHGLTRIPWFVVAGNHDHDGSLSTLIEYANSSKLFYYPSPYYAMPYLKEGYAWGVQLIALDTTPFTFALPQSEQLAWLQQQLSKHQQDVIIVFGHHPIYSNGHHGDTDSLKRHLLPLLSQYAIPIYLSGHEHSLQLLRANKGVHFLVSGAGGAPLTKVGCQQNTLYAAEQYGGFAIYITKTTLWVIPVTEATPVHMYAIPLKSITD